jgi:signal transduction histidine kinase
VSKAETLRPREQSRADPLKNPDTILVADDDAMFRRLLASWLEKRGYRVMVAEDGSSAWNILQSEEAPQIAILDWMMPGMDGIELCRRVRREQGRYRYLLLLTAKAEKEDVVAGLDAGADDYLTKPFAVEEVLARVRAGKRILELQQALLQAQKLEAIGQLAAGIAHEINTPTQYVGDNTRFLQESWQDIANLLALSQSICQQAHAGTVAKELLGKFDSLAAESDLSYLIKEVPKAIEQSLDGVQRVAKIVKAMKDFSHPGSQEKRAVDINQAIESTIAVARHEWKYVSNVVTDLQPDLPPVPCLIGEFNQVILNLIVNAAHAIAEAKAEGLIEKGTITIRTYRRDQWAEIAVQDTGTGIPVEIQPRIFEPFFTTKPVGRGTGQGLSLAHSVIVKRHQGQIWFETEIGRGTTFFLRLPFHVAEKVS